MEVRSVAHPKTGHYFSTFQQTGLGNAGDCTAPAGILVKSKKVQRVIQAGNPRRLFQGVGVPSARERGRMLQ